MGRGAARSADASRGRFTIPWPRALSASRCSWNWWLACSPARARRRRNRQLDQLDQARALVRASLADARTSIWDLRSEAGGRSKPPEDLPSRLSRSCTRIAGGSSAKVYLQVKGTYRPVTRKIEEELLRIGQEAVANAVRHAAATRIDVQLIYEAARVSLRVEDDGRGFDPPGAERAGRSLRYPGHAGAGGGDRRRAGAGKHARRGHAGSRSKRRWHEGGESGQV